MTTKLFYEDALFLQAFLGLTVFFVMGRRRQIAIYPYVAALLSLEVLSVTARILLIFYRGNLHISKDSAYGYYFGVSWIETALGLVLRILVVYGIFAEAMRPMAGLHAAGRIIFRWVAVCSTLVALALVAGPGAFTGVAAWLNIFSRLQQGVSVLTLCLLVFVCFTIRPLGLTFRSHLFGVSLGLGIAAMVDLVQAAWLVTSGVYSVVSPVFSFASLGMTLAYFAWAAYFIAPEPERRMILLPTTSPFFFWNRISEILGDAPGQVAVAGFTPGMLAPAELEMLTAATSRSEDADADSSGTMVRMKITAPRIEPAVLSSLGKALYSSPAA